MSHEQMCQFVNEEKRWRVTKRRKEIESEEFMKEEMYKATKEAQQRWASIEEKTYSRTESDEDEEEIWSENEEEEEESWDKNGKCDRDREAIRSMLEGRVDTSVLFNNWNLPDHNKYIKPLLDEREEGRMYGIEEEMLVSHINRIQYTTEKEKRRIGEEGEEGDERD